MEAYVSLYHELVILLGTFVFGFLAGRFLGVFQYRKKFDELFTAVEFLRQRVESLDEDAHHD